MTVVLELIGRQDNPLSPLMFIFVMEVLSSMLLELWRVVIWRGSEQIEDNLMLCQCLTHCLHVTPFFFFCDVFLTSYKFYDYISVLELSRVEG